MTRQATPATVAGALAPSGLSGGVPVRRAAPGPMIETSARSVGDVGHIHLAPDLVHGQVPQHGGQRLGLEVEYELRGLGA